LPAFFARREGGRAVIEGGDARHLARSLRARVGEEIEVVDPGGFLLSVRLESISADRVEGAILAQRPYNPEPAISVTIAVANLPAPALELVLSRCTEAGAYAFCVFRADRSIGRGAKLERWRTICREAAMLAGRLRVPDVSTATSLDAVVATSTNAVMLVRDGKRPLTEVVQHDMTLLIGPEGGWTERELGLARIRATLGPRNLRADTAALVGLAVALASA
jgi:16S rRNA (uracil1498-N3)-methyltransferase